MWDRDDVDESPSASTIAAGPWRIEDDGWDDKRYVRDVNGTCIAHVWGENNAHAIVASLRLIEACRSLVDTKSTTEQKMQAYESIKAILAEAPQ